MTVHRALPGVGDEAPAAGSGLVLGVLAAAQFLMTLDTSVMNVSIRQVAADLGTTVTGIQTAITLYTLVMASFMITGGKVGAMIGRRRALAIGLVVYGAGSLTTALAPNLGVLLVGWSLLEGLGAALIMPAIVALVAGNFASERRPAAYGMIAAASAVAVAVGPLVGGAVTTYASWRWVFAAEVLIVVVLLPLLRKVRDAAPTTRSTFDVVGACLSIAGLSLTVFGVLRSGEWGWVRAKPSGPSLLGVSPVVWLVIGGLLLLFCLVLWEGHLVARGREPLVRPMMLRNRQLVGGLTMFFSQYLVQAGVFFIVPLFLSVVLELSALQTGARLLPLSLALLLAAIGIPRLAPRVSPRLIVRCGLLAMLAGTLVLIGGISPGADAGIVAIPMLLMGLGMGALASQLGAITVSAVPDDQSAEVGGVQNTMTNLGCLAGHGTRRCGSHLEPLDGLCCTGSSRTPRFPRRSNRRRRSSWPAASRSSRTATSDNQLEEASVAPKTADAIVDENAAARLAALRDALWVVALVAVAALFLTGLVPTAPAGRKKDPAKGASPPSPRVA